MKYLICMKQKGEGCDYTIGCGMKFWIQEADYSGNLLPKIIFPHGYDESSIFENPEQEITELYIARLEHVTEIDLAVEKARALDIRRQQQLQKSPEYLEYLRLKKLFEP